ncbi:MAG: hypothetical protein ABJA86_02600 [Nocardioidaceae bacterium]
MPEPVVLPVPEHLLAVYAVATELPPGEDSELGSLDAHVSVESYPAESAPLPPVGLLRAMGTTSEVADKIARAATITMVQATSDASWPPVHELVARNLARRIALDHDGVVIDLRSPAALESSEPANLEEAIDSFRLVDWVRVPSSPDPDRPGAVWATTKGLTRFGLPELQVFGVPEQLTGGCVAVLSGIAHVLLREQWQAVDASPLIAFREVPREHRLTLRDVALAYSDQARDSSDPGLDVGAMFSVDLDPAVDAQVDTFLTVVPPEDYAGELADWPAHVVSTVFSAARRPGHP